MNIKHIIKISNISATIIEDDIFDKLLEIYKGSENFVLAKFYTNVEKKIWRLPARN